MWTPDSELRPWLDELRAALGPLDLHDAHTHVGQNDPDGERQTPAELLEQLAGAGARGVVFPMHEPDGYRGPNDAVLAAAAESGGRLTAFCRVDPRGSALAEATRCLDAGARGILYPHVADAGTAQRLMDQLSFPPDGTRGQGSASRAGRWGRLPGGTAAYLADGRERVVRMAMIEDGAAVDDIEAILATQRLDAIFVGPGDLSLTMGVRPGGPEVSQAVEKVIAAAVAAGVPVGTVVSTPAQARGRVDQGCDYVLVGNDTGVFGRAVAALAETTRTALGEEDR